MILLFSLDPTELPLLERSPKTSADQKGGRDVKEASEQFKSVLRDIIRIESCQIVDIFYLISASCQDRQAGFIILHISQMTKHPSIFLFSQPVSKHLSSICLIHDTVPGSENLGRKKSMKNSLAFDSS